MDPFDRPQLIAHTSSYSRANASPGPGAYNIRREFGADTPAIRFHTKTTAAVRPSTAPYYNLGTTIGKCPKVHMHTKSRAKEIDRMTGPNYVPPKFGRDCKKVKISPPEETTLPRGRSANSKRVPRRNRCETPGPGPGTYNTRTDDFERPGRRGSRISGEHNFGFDYANSPGPAAYKPRYESVLSTAPKPVMHIRPKQKDPESTPGYRNLGSTLAGSRFSMKRREEDTVYVV